MWKWLKIKDPEARSYGINQVPSETPAAGRQGVQEEQVALQVTRKLQPPELSERHLTPALML